MALQPFIRSTGDPDLYKDKDKDKKLKIKIKIKIKVMIKIKMNIKIKILERWQWPCRLLSDRLKIQFCIKMHNTNLSNQIHWIFQITIDPFKIQISLKT